jgi:uncharacterized protein YkwD
MKLPLKVFALIGVSFCLLTVSITAGMIISNVGDKKPDVVKASAVVSTITIDSLWAKTNEERANLGLQPLALDSRLDSSAQAKCDDMATRNYWDHNTPDGVEPWTFIHNAGVKYLAAGENLYYGELGTADTDEVLQLWMNSTEHRANIVKPDYDNIGFGICRAASFDGHPNAQIIVQHFADE